jgi:hypothetical protein
MNCGTVTILAAVSDLRMHGATLSAPFLAGKDNMQRGL